MNQLSGAEAMVRMLRLYGVRHVFGLCGDTSLPFYDALYRTGGDIQHILTRDERSAGYMADAYARISGRVGICEGPSGGGATYILPGLIEANESSVPVLGITTDIGVGSRGRFALTEVDQEALFRPLTKWNSVIDQAQNLPRAVRTAFAQMTSGRPGTAHLGLPFDVQNAPVDEAEVWAESGFSTYPAHRTGPDPNAVVEAAKVLGAARNPILICGGGVVISGAEADLLRLAERLEAMVATTISGKGSIPEDHPLSVGVVGSNGGTPETRALVDAADLVVLIGCRAGSVTTERWRHPVPNTVPVVHIDADPTVIGINYPTEAAVVGDARLVLAALADELGAGTGESDARARIQAAQEAKFAAFEALATSDATPIRPERVIATLESILPEDAIIVADPGTPCPYFSGYYRFRRPGRHFITNRAHGALGYSLSAVVGAQTARPEAKCVAVMGDGSFGFTSGELETIVRLGAPVTLVVLSNSIFGWIKAGQRHGFGQRFYSVDFDRTNHAKVAAAFGVKSWRVEDPADLKGALAAATEADGPTLVDIITQPLDEARAPVSEWVA